MKEKTLRKQMYAEIQGKQKNLSDSYLDSLSTQAVINNTHPLYRRDWQPKYDNIINQDL